MKTSEIVAAAAPQAQTVVVASNMKIEILNNPFNIQEGHAKPCLSL
jgi:hypothetical protein